MSELSRAALFGFNSQSRYDLVAYNLRVIKDFCVIKIRELT
jgi:hypothetical protein